MLLTRDLSCGLFWSPVTSHIFQALVAQKGDSPMQWMVIFSATTERHKKQ